MYVDCEPDSGAIPRETRERQLDQVIQTRTFVCSLPRACAPRVPSAQCGIVYPMKMMKSKQQSIALAVINSCKLLPSSRFFSSHLLFLYLLASSGNSDKIWVVLVPLIHKIRRCMWVE